MRQWRRRGCIDGPVQRCLIAAGLCAGAPACNALLDIDVARLEPGDAGLGALAAEPRLPGPAAADDATGTPGPDAGASAVAVTPDPVAPEVGAVPATNAPTPPVAAAAAPAATPPAGESSAESAPAQPSPAATPLGPALDALGFAVALPNDLLDAPVSGEIVFSEEASWEVDGVFRPTFEVHTPTASYWVVASLGTMVSMQSAYAVPALDTPPASVTTLLDRDSQTPTHLRLVSQSSDGTWRWVWDFYVTHATFTIDRAPVPIGFSYRGAPAGGLGTEDQLILADGTAQSARSSYAGDLAGPAEWVYVADGAAQHSLFLMQHTDDALPEAYQVRDNDSAHWSFGGGQITALPLRFSLGVVDSVDHATVSRRAAYVAGAIR